MLGIKIRRRLLPLAVVFVVVLWEVSLDEFFVEVSFFLEAFVQVWEQSWKVEGDAYGFDFSSFVEVDVEVRHVCNPTTLSGFRDLVSWFHPITYLYQLTVFFEVGIGAYDVSVVRVFHFYHIRFFCECESVSDFGFIPFVVFVTSHSHSHYLFRWDGRDEAFVWSCEIDTEGEVSESIDIAMAVKSIPSLGDGDCVAVFFGEW